MLKVLCRIDFRYEWLLRTSTDEFLLWDNPLYATEFAKGLRFVTDFVTFIICHWLLMRTYLNTRCYTVLCVFVCRGTCLGERKETERKQCMDDWRSWLGTKSRPFPRLLLSHHVTFGPYKIRDEVLHVLDSDSGLLTASTSNEPSCWYRRNFGSHEYLLESL